MRMHWKKLTAVILITFLLLDWPTNEAVIASKILNIITLLFIDNDIVVKSVSR